MYFKQMLHFCVFLNLIVFVLLYSFVLTDSFNVDLSFYSQKQKSASPESVIMIEQKTNVTWKYIF